jgi:uncharacterized membrane-anchored protein
MTTPPRRGQLRTIWRNPTRPTAAPPGWWAVTRLEHEDEEHYHAVAAWASAEQVEQDVYFVPEERKLRVASEGDAERVVVGLVVDASGSLDIAELMMGFQRYELDTNRLTR